MNEVGFSKNNDDPLAGFNDLPGEGLVEFRVWLGGIDKQGANISFFNCGERAQGGKFFDADFAFTGLAEASGIENFESATMESDFYAVNVAGSSLTRTNERLLFLAERIKKARFTNIGATNEG